VLTGTGLTFHKMHGAGNDFVLLDMRSQSLELDAALSSRLANRRLGIGCDQILLLYPPRLPGSVARYEIRNADGSAAGQCGNGARCIALYLAMSGESETAPMILESPAGLISIGRCADGEFEADMGEPAFAAELVPISIKPRDGRYGLDTTWGRVEFGAASMGNPHALVTVEDVDSAPVDTLGAYISRHGVFPEGCNAGFAEVLDRDNLRLRVYERGAGETLACGSGACAAVAILRRENRVNEVVNVYLPGGHLVIKWPGIGSSIRMKGPAVHVFSGTFSHA
jgi:diaminopimelate epimerase